MKSAALCLLVALGVAGCHSLDLTPETDPERVVTGTITLGATQAFPPDTEVVVRVVDLTPPSRPMMLPAGSDLPVADRGQPEKVERVVGEQLIRAPGPQPIPFRVEFHADDAALRRGLNIDVRISVSGKMTYRTLNAHVLTLASVNYPHEVPVEPVR